MNTILVFIFSTDTYFISVIHPLLQFLLTRIRVYDRRIRKVPFYIWNHIAITSSVTYDIIQVLQTHVKIRPVLESIVTSFKC